MRRGLLRVLRWCAEADPRRPRGQGDQPLAADDLLDLLEPRLVVRQHLVIRNRVFLESADHVAVVGRSEPILPGHARRHRLHLALDLRERRPGLRRELRRRDIHSHLLQSERVQLGNESEIVPGARQHFAPHERGVGGELLLQLGDGLLVPGDLVLLEELLDSVDGEPCRLQIVLQLELAGRLQAGLGQAFPRLALGELHDRGRAGLEARVLAHARQRGRTARRLDLGIEKAAHAEEHQPGEVVVRDLETLAQLGTADALPGSIRQDGEVLRDERFLLGPAQLLDPGQRLAGSLAQPLLMAGGQVGDAIVQARLAEPRRLLRREARLDGEQDLRVLVAAGDPRSVGPGRARLGGRGCARRAAALRAAFLRIVRSSSGHSGPAEGPGALL